MKLPWRSAILLSLYRFLIDRIDDGIHHLIVQRTWIARRISHHKTLLYCPEREQAILRRLKKKNRLDTVLIQDIWHPLFQESKRQQQEQREYVDSSIFMRSSPLNATWFDSLPYHINE
jgi:chorismate mutase